MPVEDKVNAVISKSETVQARLHKGNAAALHQLFVEGSAELNKLYTKDPVDMRIALANKYICLSDEQLNALCAAGKDNFFKTLLSIQQDEIKQYVDAQPHGPGGGLTGRTPGYYNDVMNLVSTARILAPVDYLNTLKNHSTATAKPGEKEADKPKGQLLQLMNREYALYAQVRSKDIDYGSKADNVRYHYYKDVMHAYHATNGKEHPKYAPWKTFVAANDKKFPGGFHIQVDTVYEKKGHVGHVKDPRPQGQGHHISIVNLGMSNEEVVNTINDRGAPCPMHEVKFIIGAKTYGVYLVDNKPLTFYKAELDDNGQFKKDVNGNLMKSELKASESANLKEGGTQLLPPFDKGYSSVTHAIAQSIKQMKETAMGLEPSTYETPILTSNSDKLGDDDFKVSSGKNPLEPVLEIGGSTGATTAPSLNISGNISGIKPQEGPEPQVTVTSLKDKMKEKPDAKPETVISSVPKPNDSDKTLKMKLGPAT